MQQLLKITTVPISYELKVNNARLERKNGTAEVEISRDAGKMQIRSKPIKLRVDTFEARNAMMPTTRTAISQAAQNGKAAAYEATAQFAKEGQIMLQTKLGEGAEALQRIFDQRSVLPTGQFELGFTPKTGPNISWEDSSFSIEYEMDKLNFDWKVNKGNVEFIPGDIELSISQYPDVKIEYMGDPIYVPPSVAARFSGEIIDVDA